MALSIKETLQRKKAKRKQKKGKKIKLLFDSEAQPISLLLLVAYHVHQNSKIHQKQKRTILSS